MSDGPGAWADPEGREAPANSGASEPRPAAPVVPVC